MKIRAKQILTVGFFAVEALLYWFILTGEGQMLIWSSYCSIVLCFLFALGQLPAGSMLAVGALACTVGADFFLVVCSPRQQLWGMVFFLAAQSLYAVRLHRRQPNRPLLVARFALIVLAEVVTVLVLRDKTDGLAVVSICYYANLLMNAAQAFAQWRLDRVFPVALVLFILCDTVIGLQVASGGYLPIGENTLLHRILFMEFNLSWFFYLPSQVMIACSARKK